jgi:hypothetical protein
MLSAGSQGSRKSGNILNSNSKNGLRRVTRAFSGFDMNQFNDINLMLRNKKDIKDKDIDDNLLQTNTIFAVNSDVYFLYMIGKICAKSGHNLF